MSTAGLQDTSKARKEPSVSSAISSAVDVFTYEAEETSDNDVAVLDHCAHLESANAIMYELQSELAGAQDNDAYLADFKNLKGGVKRETLIKELREGDRRGCRNMIIKHQSIPCSAIGDSKAPTDTGNEDNVKRLKLPEVKNTSNRKSPQAVVPDKSSKSSEPEPQRPIPQKKPPEESTKTSIVDEARKIFDPKYREKSDKPPEKKPVPAKSSTIQREPNQSLAPYMFPNVNGQRTFMRFVADKDGKELMHFREVVLKPVPPTKASTSETTSKDDKSAKESIKAPTQYTSLKKSNIVRDRTQAVLLGGMILEVDPPFRNSMARSAVWFNLDTYEWGRCDALPYGRSFHQSVSFQDSVVLLGGSDEQDRFMNTVFVHEATSSRTGKNALLSSIPPLKIGRSAHAAVVFGNNIYVMGGKSDLGYSNCPIEVLKVDEDNKWTSKCIETPVRACSFSLFKKTSSLWVVGGIRSQDDYIVTSPLGTELNLDTLQVESQSTVLPYPLFDGCSVVIQGTPHIFGGVRTLDADTYEISDDILSYKPALNKFQVVGKLSFPLSNARAVCKGNQVFVFGGVKNIVTCDINNQVLCVTASVATDSYRCRTVAQMPVSNWLGFSAQLI